MEPMNSIETSAIAGLIAALAATTILGLASYVRGRWVRRRDEIHIRQILLDGKKAVMGAEHKYLSNIRKLVPADVARVGHYNKMITKLSIALEKWALGLSHKQRKDLFDALDWFHTDHLFVHEESGILRFKEFPDGKWTHGTLQLEEAQYKFEQLHAIKWLKFKRD